MKRFFLLLGAVVALLMLATTAAFAGEGKGKSDAAHGQATQATHGKSGVSQGHAVAAPAKINASAGAQPEQSSAQSTVRTRGKGKAGAKVHGSAKAPGCNGTIHLSAGAGAGNGTDPKYTQGEDVWAHGRGFDSPETFTWYEVEDVNDHATVLVDDTPWTAADGSFDKWGIDTATLSDAHEYKLTVYWNETLPNGRAKECHKSKNFFVQAEEEQGGTGGTGGTGGSGETGGTAGTGGTGGSGSGGVSAGSGVAGATASGSVRGESGGVLGAVGSAATRNLPFTGLPVWIPLLAGAALLATGLVLRRHAHATR